MSEHHGLWVEQFRPKELKDYIGNPQIVDTFSSYIEKQDIPHILLHSTKPGTGKTTAAKLLASKIQSDVLYINASYENKVETVREKIVSFASTIGFNGLKIVILDEADYITGSGLAALRNVMEQFSRSTRFILTCNYIERLIEPVVSRCQVFEIIPPDKIQIAEKLASILQTENITFNIKDVVRIVKQTYPDIRKAIGTCQQYSSNGALKLPETVKNHYTYVEDIISILTKKDRNAYTSIRKLITNSGSTSFEVLYKSLFDELETYCKDTSKQGLVVLVIHDYVYKDSMCIDKELNAVALIVKLLELLNG